MIKAVILDLDDTLCLTEEACWYLENETLASINRRPIPRDLHHKTWGEPLFEIMPVRSPGVDITKFRLAYAPIIKKR